MSKVRGVRAASSQIKFELPLLDLITAYPSVVEHGQTRGAQLTRECWCWWTFPWFGNFKPLFSRMCVCDETLGLPESTPPASGREERNAVSIIGKKFGLRSKRSFLFRAAGDPRGCFLFKHKGCFKALKVNKFDLVIQMAQMTIFP